VEDALLRWLRAAELTCDRAALLVAQDSSVVIGALMKLAGGSPAFAHELSVEAFLQQVRVRAAQGWCVCLMSGLFLPLDSP
jgi:Zn-dependent protease with chaperone function